MRFTAKPHKGLLPIKFGMSKSDIKPFLPTISDFDIPTFGSAEVMPLSYLKIHFSNGEVDEITVFTGTNNHKTGQLAQTEPDLDLVIDYPDLPEDTLLLDQALDVINKKFKAKYEPTIWLYPDLCMSFCGYDRSLDYRSITIFLKKDLDFFLETMKDAPLSTQLRKRR
ncbi:hypothetical protein [Fibrella aquatilis]|uniref:Uncharacterized protein n=1 Tax=Fibrella aquatilis TaxID=2817059 RepID=A0A939G7H9_9BACT|nr:hypothetical protein [Fibrella aquatilis]MBO0933301.1 hypothetical protein [Fibrella aquatilis]